jgi:hypothetical protein
VSSAGSDGDLRMLVECAVRAPSSHNTQPWRFSLGPDMIGVIADRSRRLPVNDPDDRELTMSCGAALLNLRVAAARAGFSTQTALCPDADDPDLLATMRLVEGEPEQDMAALFAQVPRRSTHRAPFARTAFEGEAAGALVDAARSEGAELHVLDDERRHAVGALVADGDRLQFADRRWRHELATWMRSRRSGDGLTVPLAALVPTRIVVTSADLGRRVAEKNRRLAAAAPIATVLTTAGDSPVDWMVAGQALQRALLVAAGFGVHAGYLNQPCQVAALRPRLADVTPGAGAPHAVLRFGRPARRARPSPRRPLDDVIVSARG